MEQNEYKVSYEAYAYYNSIVTDRDLVIDKKLLLHVIKHKVQKYLEEKGFVYNIIDVNKLSSEIKNTGRCYIKNKRY